jgi:ring-1,2-phenylacetyl-CoA epoxidase subunit PaaC
MAATDPDLAQLTLELADDELVLGHRDSEWCGLAPLLEEDIAFANLALDELGHARLWYTLHARFTGNDPDTFPDQLVFFRSANEYRSIALVELPRGDWAFSICRRFLFDAAEQSRLAALANHPSPEIAGAARRIAREEIYHLRHSQAWMKRLGLGTEESRRRLQHALDTLWPYTSQLFELSLDPALLAASAMDWARQVIPFLESCSLQRPDSQPAPAGRSVHTHHLASLLAEMQSVARMDPLARW